MPDLTCAVVHWNLPGLLADCLASLLPEAERLRRRGLDVQVVVVDNDSRPDVRERLRAETPEGVRVVWSEENLGYPRACNLAYDATDAPLFLLSNPDVVYLPGSLEALVRALDGAPEAALAGPATWWDRERTLLMNPGYPEDRERLEADAEARRTGTWPAHALAWERRMAELAFAPETREAEILSGACMLVRRERIDAAGGLFDPALFLYYDDTDLCFRLRARGLPILYVPDAEIVHLFNQSRRSDVADRMAASRRHFLAKHYGPEEAEWLLRLAAEAVPAEDDFSAWRPRDLGVLSAPRPFTWEAPGPSLFALGLNPQVVPAAMARCARPELRLGEAFWDQLTPGPYWARATDPASGRVLAYWKLVRP
ncbi:MAG TPA: glycosyltransferase family 2 protein [Thermoanaerobaculia bacterium]|nr:glycosyltransferase family 2 protein [Thermoanaerobaculia bacterium]